MVTRKKHWTFNRLLTSQRALKACVVIAEGTKDRKWIAFKSGMNEDYVNYMVSDLIKLEMVVRVKRGQYEPRQKMFDFLKLNGIPFNGGKI